jgi:dTDP-4-dehydrorhamnose reductase
VELDITDADKVNAALSQHRPDVVLNCAAITNVDGCESNEELADKVNAYGAEVLAKACAAAGAKLMHISTDYVFRRRGEKALQGDRPDLPGERLRPLEAQGRKKISKNSAITTPYSARRGSTARTAIISSKRCSGSGRSGGEVAVVTDQVGNPTSTFELVRMLDAVITAGGQGIFHATCEGVCSWNEFAREIFKTAGMDVKVSDTTSDRLARRASRPAYSVLCKDRLAEVCGCRPADWHAALREYFDYQAGRITF